MENSFEIRFISQAIEKTPYTDTAARNVLIKWCEINGITLQCIPRSTWEQTSKRPDENNNGSIVWIPEDLHFWEMAKIINQIEPKTQAGRTEKGKTGADKIQEVGEIFEKAGRYIQEYTQILDDEREKQIAETIAREWYQYGRALQYKEKEEPPPQENKLSPQDKQELDKWFLGTQAYERRQARLGENPSEEQEEERRKKLFKAYIKALTRKGYKADGDQPWETKKGPIQHIQERTRKQITASIATPQGTMHASILRRGIHTLIHDIKIPGWQTVVAELVKKGYTRQEAENEVTLMKTLEISQLKDELENVRARGNLAEVARTELTIAQKIQAIVRTFPFQSQNKGDVRVVHQPQIEGDLTVNCLRATLIGIGLLTELGIKCWYVHLPQHAATILRTSDGKIYWQDFRLKTDKGNYTQITPDMIINKKYIGEKGIVLEFTNWNPYPHVKGNLTVTVLPPEVGMQRNVRRNTAIAYHNKKNYQEAIESYQQGINVNPEDAELYEEKGRALFALQKYEEAIEAHKEAIKLNPENADPYYGLGKALIELKRYKEAIKAYQQAIKLNPKNPYSYYGLGRALFALEKYEEAKEAYQQAIKRDQENPYPYYGLGKALTELQRYEEAIEAYETFIQLWRDDQSWITKAEKNIKKLKTQTGSR